MICAKREPALADLGLLVSRFLIAVLFLGGAVQKIASPPEAMALLTALNLPAAFVWPALVLKVPAGLMLLMGLKVRYVALMLAAYCGATSIFHWIPQDPWQMSIFVKSWAIAGGCLALAVGGSGRLAVLLD